jgi:hypothetical protein
MRLYDPDRHEALAGAPWDADAARAAIERIVAETRAAASPEGFWPNYPEDAEDGAPPHGMLYMGAAGVIWALDYLVREGATAPGETYAAQLPAIAEANRAASRMVGGQTRSFLMGDAGVWLTHWNLTHSPETLETLAGLIAGNTDDPTRELMWGAPGTMLIALALHAQTGEARWAELFAAGAEALEATFEYDDALGAHLWTQDIYGHRLRHLGAVHGFAGNAYVLARGRHLLAPDAWARWSLRLAETFTRTALEADIGLNWAPAVDPRERKRLVQHCHGAPGMVTCLAALGEPIDAALLGGGELTWAAGPLRKGSNLCHGTAGNGYAFLKLHARTRDATWLERARAFAMHAIAQSEADAAALGQRRFSLWTGDLGLAIYLWDCIEGQARFPTMDVL